MFCYQCEQTAKGKGCTIAGVCGKDAVTAALQDLLVYETKGIAKYANEARKLGKCDEAIDKFLAEALFTTITNVNFDADSVENLVYQAEEVKTRARSLYEAACAEQGKTPETFGGPAEWKPGSSRDELLAQAEAIGISARIEKQGETIVGLQELATYGLKGLAAYMDHATILGQKDPKANEGLESALAYLADEPADVDDLFKFNLDVGALNLKTMELLDAANTGKYGDPEPTPVRITPVKGKAIVVSGHDLRDLELLLQQTEGKGINVYTHGEMLPCHGYPELKKYKHLVGNYGGAWQDQQKEFDAFPGAILMTTNCIQKPRDSYKDRIFTTGLVQWPGVVHIGEDKDFTPVIEAALAAPGFAEDEPEKTILVGFGHEAVLSVAPQVIDAVKAGKIRHFFLIGGCDGARPGRNYYTEFAQAVPDDCVILTLACGKYRFNKLEFGDIGGIPRLLDIGQCNDAYSAIKIASALAEAFGTDVNGLPLSMILSWYEQKAVSILLTLLHLGIKDIRLGPTLPAFVTEPALKVLVDLFGLKPITTVEEDLKACLAG